MDWNSRLEDAKRRRILLPWETGFAAHVLNPGYQKYFPRLGLTESESTRWDPVFIRAALVGADDNPSSSSAGPNPDTSTVVDTAAPSLLKLGRRREPIPWTKKLDEERHVALTRWHIIIDQNPEASKLGRTLLAMSGKEGFEEKFERSINDVFENKATGTLNLRSGSLLMFSRWLITIGLPGNIFPISEELAYDYLSLLRTERAPASRGQKFRESVSFAFGTIEAEGCLEVMKSQRCQGASSKLTSSKLTTKQRDPLLVPQVEAFEQGVFDLQFDHEKILSGDFAALIHVRGRFSDVYHCQTEPTLDVVEGAGFFEIPVTDTKVSRRSKLRKVLPLTGHAFGLTGLPWAAEWLKIRKQCGLDAAGGPLITAIRSSGQWTKARMRSSEAVTWMKLILSKMHEIRRAKSSVSPNCLVYSSQIFGTHPCKITFLSWLSKAGSDQSDREMLGYHTTSVSKTALLYARDAWAGPLRCLWKLLLNIRSRRFDPDVTRSGRWKLLPLTDEEERQITAGQLEPGPALSVSPRLIPGIDFSPRPEFVETVESDVGSPAIQVGRRMFNRLAFHGDEYVSSDDGFGGPFDWDRALEPKLGESGDERSVHTVLPKPDFVCKECEMRHQSDNTIWECNCCEKQGCSECLPVVVKSGSLKCYWCCSAAEQQFETVIESEDEAPKSESDSSSSSNSSSDESSAEAAAADLAAEEVASVFRPRKASHDQGDFMFQHKTRRTVHLIKRSSLDYSILSCGRKVTDQFEKLASFPNFEFPMCIDCFGK